VSTQNGNTQLTPEDFQRLNKAITDFAEHIIEHVIEHVIKPFLATFNKIVEQYPELFHDPKREDRQRSREDLRRKRQLIRGNYRHIKPTKGR